MLLPHEIILNQQNQEKDKNNRRAQVGLIKGIIDDAKSFFVRTFQASVEQVVRHTFNVTVENQVEFPDTQKIEGNVSLKEIREILLGLQAVKTAVLNLNELAKPIKALSKDLKPEKIDFSSLEKAIKAIELPETVIPAYPTAMAVSNLTDLSKDLKKYLDDLGKKLAVLKPEAMPEFPTEIRVTNFPEIKIPKPVAPVVNVDTDMLYQVMQQVLEAIQGLRFPIPTFRSSWDRSVDMKASDVGKAYAYTTVGGAKAISTITVVVGGVTYVKTFTYTSSDAKNPDLESAWVAQ